MAGGVLLGKDGSWMRGFSINIGVCPAPLTELWGAYYDFFAILEYVFRRMELELDSELVVGFLRTGISEAHLLCFLVRLCHDFFTKDWIVRVIHVYREANRLTDGLANYAF